MGLEIRVLLISFLSAYSAVHNASNDVTTSQQNLVEHVSHVIFRDYDCTILSPLSSMVPWQDLQNIMGHLPSRHPNSFDRNTFDHQQFLKTTCPDTTQHPFVGKVHTFNTREVATPANEYTYRGMIELVKNNWREGYEECPFGTLAVLILDVLCGGDQVL